MKLTTGLLIDDTILYRGEWEPGITKVIVGNLNTGDIFLDIGANIGYDSLLASHKVGPQGKIIAFEPNTVNYEKFLENIKLNNFTNIDVQKKGVGNSNVKLKLFYDEKNPGATSLVQGNNHSKNGVELIEIVRLDDILGEMKVDLIKLDIEGFEYEAIKGMMNVLSNNQGIKMIFEFSPYIYKKKEENYIQYSIEILEYLGNIGFYLFHISQHDGTLEKITNFAQYTINIDSHKGQSDIYCTKTV